MPLERFKHQREIVESTKDREAYALLWEMRVGKNLPIIDTAAHLYDQGKIDAVMVIAPSGVHINWARTVIPPERPHDSIIEWSAGVSGKVSFKQRWDRALSSSSLLWVCVNVEAMATASYRDLQGQLTKAKRTMRVIDESHRLKSPTAMRTKYAINTTPHFPYRRILTGTAAPNSPFDLWSQFACLDPQILGPRFVPFKQRYGVFQRVRYGGPAFDKLVSYKDLDNLKARIAPHSSRLTQSDVYDNLPDLTTQHRTFVMSEVQQQAYQRMKNEMLLELSSGLTITVQQAIVMMLRLQQISRGFISSQDGMVHDLGGPKPSIAALIQDLEMIDGKVIIWANFTEDVNSILKSMDEEGLKAVRYDGQTSKEDRYNNLQLFLNDPETRYLVGTPATGGTGLDVSVAQTTYFYSHSYKLAERLQAVARNQGPNQKSNKLLLVSLVAEETGDATCLQRLDEKMAMMQGLMGDKIEDPQEHLKILKQFLES